MDDTKPELQVEKVETVMHHSITRLAQNEDEPQSPYELGWKTIAALIALSLANCCAALSNTVGCLTHMRLFNADHISDKYSYQVSSSNTRAWSC